MLLCLRLDDELLIVGGLGVWIIGIDHVLLAVLLLGDAVRHSIVLGELVDVVVGRVVICVLLGLCQLLLLKEETKSCATGSPF